MTMLRSLLDERFSLRSHRAMRQLPIFSLETVRGDRRPGAQVRKASRECAAANDAFPSGPDASVPPDECAPGNRFEAASTGARITLKRRGITMARLATMLIPFAHRPVVDG